MTDAENIADAEATEDGRPVIFEYSASSNISFRGSEDSGFTWGEWRQMSSHERQEAYIQFIYNNLGVEVFELEPGKEDEDS
jgi:hypothetical protein